MTSEECYPVIRFDLPLSPFSLLCLLKQEMPGKCSISNENPTDNTRVSGVILVQKGTERRI